MARVFAIGATGGVGSRLLHQLTEHGDPVLALHREPRQAAALTKQGATPVLGDLTELDTATLAGHLRGCDGSSSPPEPPAKGWRRPTRWTTAL
ncbi:NAD(P)H-binding protein [Streptomyces sp. NPDC101455]|uniref:NAD(P)H-binding protein n=1 Tax=Streptomyces sp. NPDC101455 TaxID=3366142 RepID=UPI003811ABB5